MWSAKINGSTAKYAGLSEVNPVVTPYPFHLFHDLRSGVPHHAALHGCRGIYLHPFAMYRAFPGLG